MCFQKRSLRRLLSCRANVPNRLPLSADAIHSAADMVQTQLDLQVSRSTDLPRILIATTGSLGDLNPMIAIGRQLRKLGADVTVAALSCYKIAIQSNGFGFLSIGGREDYVQSLRYTREMLAHDSFELFVERVNFEQLDTLYAQLLEAVRDADILVAPAHVVPAHLVAEKRGIPYVACALCLIHIKSPATAGSEEYKRLAASSARWNAILRRLRQDQRLERRVLPFASLLSDASKVLGVLPHFLLSPGDFRTPNLEVVGYADHAPAERMIQDERLRSFCDERTVAFSFGSFADTCDPMHFLQESIAACRELGLKCVYLSRQVTSEMLEMTSQEVQIRSDVAPDAVFPLVGIAVHHGGTGTLVAACKHAKPMVIVPFFLDQPLHADRMQNLIGSPHIPARDYTRARAVEALRHTLMHRAHMIASLESLRRQCSDGAEQAAHQILSALRT
jgi:rhamnosyltransferase subunit B